MTALQAWAHYLAANRRAADAYAYEPLSLAWDNDVSACRGCTHLTSHPSHLCAACRKDRA